MIAKGESAGSRSRRTEHLLRMRKARCVPAAVVEQHLLLSLLLDSLIHQTAYRIKAFARASHKQCTQSHLHISWWHAHKHAGVRTYSKTRTVCYSCDGHLASRLSRVDTVVEFPEVPYLPFSTLALKGEANSSYLEKTGLGKSPAELIPHKIKPNAPRNGSTSVSVCVEEQLEIQ